MTTMTEMVRDMVFNCGVPAKEVAAELRKPYPTLLREINPDDDGAKLGADILGDIMTKCGDVTPLRFLALQMGYRISPLSSSDPDKSTLHEELADDLQALAKYQKALTDGAEDSKLAELLEFAIMELEENLVLHRRNALRQDG